MQTCTWRLGGFLVYAILLNFADGAISGWTNPTISGKGGTGTLSVSETQATDTTIATYVATTNATGVTYSLVPEVPPFSLTGGVLTITANLDAGTKASYTLKVQAVDDGKTPDTGTATITVTVTDVPAFDQTTYTVCIADASPADTPLITVLAKDLDVGGTITESIASGNTKGDFIIDGTTGVIQVNTGKMLDKAATASYTLVVNAVDNESTPQTGSTTVSVEVKAECNGATVAALSIMTILMALVVTM